MYLKVIAKFCLLLVILGFLSPMACDRNAFQLIDSGMLITEGAVAVYIAFILSIIGLIIGIALLMKRNVPNSIDWLTTITVSGIVIVMFCYIGYGQGYIDYFQSGSYMALVGAIAALIFQFIPLLLGNVTNNIDIENKNCPYCANVIKREAVICQFCGKDIPNDFVPTHRVKLLTNTDGMSIRKNQNTNIEPFDKIPNDTEIQLISIGSEISFNEIKGNWYFIKTKENIYGWCFSGSLEKL